MLFYIVLQIIYHLCLFKNKWEEDLEKKNNNRNLEEKKKSQLDAFFFPPKKYRYALFTATSHFIHKLQSLAQRENQSALGEKINGFPQSRESPFNLQHVITFMTCHHNGKNGRYGWILRFHPLSCLLSFAAAARTQAPQRHLAAEGFPVTRRPESLAALRLRRARPLGKSCPT